MQSTFESTFSFCRHEPTSVSSETDAMLKTIRHRYETHFDIHDQILLVDSANASCAGLRTLRLYLARARESILDRLQKPLVVLDQCVQFLATLRRQKPDFPVCSWPRFSERLFTHTPTFVTPNCSRSHTRRESARQRRALQAAHPAAAVNRGGFICRKWARARESSASSRALYFQRDESSELDFTIITPDWLSACRNCRSETYMKT